jgi:hypothetical protein
MLPPDKKAVSLIVSYVLLISIGLSISGLVFGWLKFYVNIEDSVQCPEGVSFLIVGSKYQEHSPGSVSLNLTIQNKGRFNIEGYIVRINNRTGSKVAINNIYRPEDLLAPRPDRTFPIKPNQIVNHMFDSTYLSSKGIGKICFLEIQPYIKDEQNQTIPCSQTSTRKIDCSA